MTESVEALTWAQRISRAVAAWDEWEALPEEHRMDRALKRSGFRDLIVERDAALARLAETEKERDEKAESFHAAVVLLNQTQDNCPLCGHEWSRHDPEDGMCDAHSKEGLGVCECGRDVAWMQGKIAELSRAALDPEQQ